MDRQTGRWSGYVAGLCASLVASVATAEDHTWPASYNVIWNSPSTRAVDSMPMGGGNIALNVWSTGDNVLLYIGSPDSWVEAQPPQLVKLARLRLTMTPNPLVRAFRQELDVATNSIRISGSSEDGVAVSVRIWVDPSEPVVRMEGRASQPIAATVAVEIWRGEGQFDGTSAEWHHRQEGPSQARRKAIAGQSLESIASTIPDPLENLTFGGRLSGESLLPDSAGEGIHEGFPFRYWRLKTTQEARQFTATAALRIAQDPTIDIWKKEVLELETARRSRAEEDWDRATAWWKAFWDRSHIVINPDASPSDEAWQVGRNYQLFRAMQAANTSGRLPTLFNGGAFVCDANPDQRQWGHAGFMGQNLRLVYWPLLKTGDSDLMRVALEFYAERQSLARAWARHFWDIDGGVYTEDIDLFGLPAYSSKGGHTTPACLQYHYTSCMEFALMMLERGRYTGENIERYIPVVDGIIRFYDQFYRRQNKLKTGEELDDNGRLVIYPGNALEVYAGTRNDSAAVAGLMALADALLALPEGTLRPEDRAYYQGFRSRLAPIPVRTWREHLCISPAETWEFERQDFNMELPQLYPVFPFRRYGMGRPELELARNTWLYGYTDESRQKNHFCWYQGGIFTACLGLTEEAKWFALARFLHPPRIIPGPNRKGLSPWKLNWLDTPGWQVPRYPAFWDNTEFCARPDIDHGGAGMVQLQEMLLQTVGDRILLLPAWPSDWDVDFKLHAPRQTVVEARVRDGQIKDLRVDPPERRKDVEVPRSFLHGSGKPLSGVRSDQDATPTTRPVAPSLNRE